MNASALEVGVQLCTLPMQPVLSPWPCEVCVPPESLSATSDPGLADHLST